MQEAYDALGRVLGTTDQVRSTWYCPLCDRGHPNRGSNPTERARHYLDTFEHSTDYTPRPVELILRRTTKISEEEATVVFANYQNLPVFGGELLVSLQQDRVYSTIRSLFKPDRFFRSPPL